uniref:Hypothetical chloroplast RF54 n=1 Tax=Membranoptera platyphylla TaxID=1204437 RepID=A0A1I9KQH3_9FLOR|nr:hypothetical chloroplast RF54 [Membranoptera platyphylla]AMJ16852.1 hypothetical chloroplast RF54 [Membranoptera platyphylla]
MVYNYHFALASQNFLLNEEPLEEILRERTEYYQNRKKSIDFWFVLNPNFIDFSKFDMNYSNINNSYAAIISLDKNFIKWLKLRIGFVVIGEFTSTSVFLPNL